jgi:uncharacterized protein YcbK (DUF882 family)
MNHRTKEAGTISRRAFVRRLLAAAPAALLLPPATPAGAATERRALSFRHTHTGESLSVSYYENGAYLPEALARVDRLLRDFRTGEVHPIDPELLDILHEAARTAGSRGVYEVVSGYRSPATNAALREKSNGVARRSLHMQGRAIDVRLTDVETAELREIALALKRGGVGYYAKSGFVHLDTGRFRTW